jgi:hypothetical protein
MLRRAETRVECGGWPSLFAARACPACPAEAFFERRRGVLHPRAVVIASNRQSAQLHDRDGLLASLQESLNRGGYCSFAHSSRITKKVLHEVSKSVKCFFVYINFVQGDFAFPPR